MEPLSLYDYMTHLHEGMKTDLSKKMIERNIFQV
jgi:hypothetical protein